MKRILSLAVVLVATASMAASAAAADWSSSVGKASVKPTDECAIVSPQSGKAWSVFKPSKVTGSLTRPASWSDGSSFKGSRGLLARSVKPTCGGGGVNACGQWVAFWGYGGLWYIYVPC